MRIFIVGYMGSGKTQTGFYISKKLGYQFVDLDILVEEAYGKKISEIFDIEGENTFRKIEAEILRSVSLNNENIVISTGGGTPCFYNNMEFMNQNGITVYLKLPAKLLAERLINNKDKRPLISKFSNFEDLFSFIKQHRQKREIDCYANSKIIADMAQISLDQLFSIINYTLWIKKT